MSSTEQKQEHASPKQGEPSKKAEKAHTNPAATTHHVSDVDTWGGRDRHFFVFACLSLAMGFFGFDHFYLRSFGTGTQKFLVNIFGFGFWYWWDVIQVLTDSAAIQKEGLASPLDWIRGIGRGVFVKPFHLPGTSAKSYVLYAFLAICLGFLGADKFYLGETWQGVAKLVSCFNIFLLLFGWMWVAWDAFHVFFMTESILKDGVSPPMPYSYIVPGTVPGDVFKVNGGKGDSDSDCGLFPCPEKLLSFLPTIPSFPIGDLYKGVVAPLMTPPLVRALEAIKPPSMPGAAATALPVPGSATALPVPGSAAALPAPGLTHYQQRGIYLQTKDQSDPLVVAEQAERARQGAAQGGGGRLEGAGGGVGAVIAGALTALVVAGGAKGFFDVLNKQFS